MEIKKTARGFAYVEFTDHYGEKCNIQKSSIATEHCIWMGIADKDCMHLSMHQVRAILPLLQHFAETGEIYNFIPTQEQADSMQTSWDEQKLNAIALLPDATAGKVCDEANAVGWKHWHFCTPCNAIMPVGTDEGKTCIWCGHDTESHNPVKK